MLYNHYPGANNVNNMASEAEFTLANGHYQGEKKRWLFKKLVRQQVDQHSILKGLKYHGHCGIDQGQKSDTCWRLSRRQHLTPLRPKSWQIQS